MLVPEQSTAALVVHHPPSEVLRPPVTLAAVLWDMAGLLVDTEPMWTVAEVELAAALGGTWTDEIKGGGGRHAPRRVRPDDTSLVRRGADAGAGGRNGGLAAAPGGRAVLGRAAGAGGGL